MADDNTLPDASSPGEPSAPAETLHDEVARAFEEVETRDAPQAPDAPGKAGSPLAPPPDVPAPGERARGADGRFVQGAPEAPRPGAPKPPAASAAAPGTNGAKAPAGAPKPPEQAAQPPAQQLRPPVTWKPTAREHWTKLPADVQQEVVRRENEVARTMQESASARNALQHVQQVIGPYAQNIAATGGDAIAAIQTLFQADNTLRHGSIAEKAGLVASLVKNYGVDIVALDSALAGQAPQSDPNAMLADQMRREMRQQLQPVMQYFNTVQGNRRQALQQIDQNASSEVETFGQDTAHEFFEDVRADMADIIDLYTQRGMTISLHDAYERAININPAVREIVAGRAEQERASAAAQAAQRARRTAASISSAPAPAGRAPGPAGDDRRAQITAAWDESQGS